MAAEDYFVHRHRDSVIPEDHLDVWKPIHTSDAPSRSIRPTASAHRWSIGPNTRRPWRGRYSSRRPGPPDGVPRRSAGAESVSRHGCLAAMIAVR
jgi:hypothetical protein